jgi:hypothetical protein
MTPKPHRDPDADAAMLGYLTGLGAAICKAWLEAPTFKSAEAIKAALLSDGDDHSIATVRSEIEAYAMARVKNEPRRTMLRDRNRMRLVSETFTA